MRLFLGFDAVQLKAVVVRPVFFFLLDKGLLFDLIVLCMS